MMTCGNGDDDVSLVSDSTNGHRILDNVDTPQFFPSSRLFSNIWQLVVQCTKRMTMMVNSTAHTEAISNAPGRATL